MANVFSSKKRASAFCKRKNKHARKYVWTYYKRDLGGYVAYKRRK